MYYIVLASFGKGSVVVVVVVEEDRRVSRCLEENSTTGILGTRTEWICTYF